MGGLTNRIRCRWWNISSRCQGYPTQFRQQFNFSSWSQSGFAFLCLMMFVLLRAIFIPKSIGCVATGLQKLIYYPFVISLSLSFQKCSFGRIDKSLHLAIWPALIGLYAYMLNAIYPAKICKFERCELGTIIFS